MSDMRDIQRLLDIMAALRDPKTGCPWDIEQDFASIAPYTIEEAYEVADAIDRGDLDDLCDELGDLLLQVVFHARMAEEQGAFAFAEVARAISDKMQRRHPHVFADVSVDDADGVTRLAAFVVAPSLDAREIMAGYTRMFMPALFARGGAPLARVDVRREHADGPQVAVLLGVVEAVADDELVRDVPADVLGLHGHREGLGLAQQRGDLLLDVMHLADQAPEDGRIDRHGAPGHLGIGQQANQRRLLEYVQFPLAETHRLAAAKLAVSQVVQRLRNHGLIKWMRCRHGSLRPVSGGGLIWIGL